MRKLLLVLVAFAVLPLLTACWNKVDDGNILGVGDNSVSNQDEDSLEDLREKTPMTLEDLDRINKNKFPVSYTYSVYNGDEVIETWEYTYPENVDYNVLLPIEKTAVNREVISSVMSHDRINTVVNVTLENWETYSILYITDPDTLEYLGASYSTPTTTTLYTFSY